MMNAQQSMSVAATGDAAVRSLPAGRVVALGAGGGEVSIVSGRVWLTSAGDPGDHVLGVGESFRVRDSGATLVEPWTRGVPAVIRWQPRSLGERVHDRIAMLGERCWDIVDPRRRFGVGTVAALAAVLAAGALFGPVSEARSRALAGPVAVGGLLHNADRGAAGAMPMQRTPIDVSDTGERSRGIAQEARRHPAGAA